MKKLFTVLLLCFVLTAFTAYAQDGVQTVPDEAEPVPVLTSVSFNNARINEKFSPYTNEYTLTLDNPEISPTLKDLQPTDALICLLITFLTRRTINRAYA